MNQTQEKRSRSKGIALEHLKAWREYRVLSRKELAEKAGVNRQLISNYESGGHKATPATIRKLAGGLEITPQLLIYTTPQLPTQSQAV